MQKTIIALSSITYAIKAKNLLDSKGIRCEIIRTPKNLGSGCGYSIKVSGEPQLIFSELESAGIRWKAHTEI